MVGKERKRDRYGGGIPYVDPHPLPPTILHAKWWEGVAWLKNKPERCWM